MGHRKGLLKVRVGGGVNVTYAPDASFCEINTGALYALEAIQLEIEQLSQRVEELRAVDKAVRSYQLRALGQEYAYVAPCATCGKRWCADHD